MALRVGDRLAVRETRTIKQSGPLMDGVATT
jgi:hypothetical protein